MKYLKTILISLIVSIICSIGIIAYAYNYIPIFPVNLLDENGERMLGASITELSGTDTMSNFPTTYNANLNALNDGKIEVSTTSVASIITLANLSSIGTIGSGIWNGNEITVAYGGTGSTSPTLNMVMLGNGSSGFKVIGFGSSGQFLTSQGSGSEPQWTTSSIDEAGNYTWTGIHSWSDETTFNGADTHNATSTFNGIMIGGEIINSYTGGVAITAGQPVYLATSTNKIFLSDADDTSTFATEFIGFALTGGGDNDTIYVQTAGVVSGLSGLTPGAEYYVSDTVGTISTTMGVIPLMVGIARSATELLIKSEIRTGAAISRTDGVTYFAYTDGFAYGYTFAASTGSSINCVVDGVTISQAGGGLMTANEKANVSCRIKKHTSWVIDGTGSTVVIKFQPIN